ncbi:MAG TPA: acetyl-CoA hydrolase/transferase C-terminal domain-containing protein [Xanthomonadales bacterium]|nr:acetyl-CoA hydrolase/transferase C-terminal domain-containing protein [Xanthomonadales bacterium]
MSNILVDSSMIGIPGFSVHYDRVEQIFCHRNPNVVTSSFTTPDAIAKTLVERVGKRIVMALPLGIGKPCHVVNALVEIALADSSVELHIFTALTLETPPASGEIEKRFMEPAMQRLFGDYPKLRYAQLQRQGALPDNIRVNEFFFLAGRWLGNQNAQSAYISANYTHVLGYMLERGVNVVAQLLAHRDVEGGKQFSLSCNTDITVDLLSARRNGKADFVVVAQTNSELPFMMGDALVEPEEIDLLLDDPQTDFELFSAPRRQVTVSDQAIGLHAAGLVQDGGTLQVGIGSVGDAVSAALILRHRKNDVFKKVIDSLTFGQTGRFSDCGTFQEGLYASSEMFVNGLLELVDHGVIKRDVDGALVHAGFFVESRSFYRKLREMSDEQRNRFQMKSVAFTNHLYGDEKARVVARKKACFINNAMKATLLGAVISDGLENGAVVSGVGGQFNFVTQAFALPDARSVLTLASTRSSRGSVSSNIVWSFAHETVPRHMRDIVITEYGIADLRGKSDQEVIEAMLAIADARFQEGLLAEAKAAGKIDPDYEIPRVFKQNTPGRVGEIINQARKGGLLAEFPFGTDFTDIEQRLLPALNEMLQAGHSIPRLLRLIRAAWSFRVTDNHQACLERMSLNHPRGLSERFYALLLKGALVVTEA